VQPDVNEMEAQRKAAEEALTKAKLKRLAEMQVSATRLYKACYSTAVTTLGDDSSVAAAASATATFVYDFDKKSQL
jgi:hypothetical protein